MEEEILDAEPLVEGEIKNKFLNVILYVCLLVYPIEFLMGYRTLTFDYSTALGDTLFSPVHGPLCSLAVFFMVPLGIITSLVSYIGLEKDRISNKAVFLLTSPTIQLFIYLVILFLL